MTTPPVPSPSLSPDLPIHRPGLVAIFLAFSKIGLTAFGGGIGGWMLRDFVHTRRWIEEADVLNALPFWITDTSPVA